MLSIPSINYNQGNNRNNKNLNNCNPPKHNVNFGMLKAEQLIDAIEYDTALIHIRESNNTLVPFFMGAIDKLKSCTIVNYLHGLGYDVKLFLGTNKKLMNSFGEPKLLAVGCGISPQGSKRFKCESGIYFDPEDGYTISETGIKSQKDTIQGTLTEPEELEKFILRTALKRGFPNLRK